MATALVTVEDIHPASWHEQRALGVGGSDAASLFNAGWGCKRRLTYEKRRLEPDYHRNESSERILKRGNKLEDIVADEFVGVTGLKVRKQPSRVSRTYPHARVNMDRQIVAATWEQLRDLTMDESGFSIFDSLERLEAIGPGALECKTMDEFVFRKVEKEGFLAHDHYLLQLQHTLAVTGYQWGFFCIMSMGSFRPLWFPMVRNEALCKTLLESTEHFWKEYVDQSEAELPGRLPDGDKRCKSCLYRKTCRGEQYLQQFAGADFSTDYVEVDDPELIELARDFVSAGEGLDQAESIRDEIKQRIRAFMERTGNTKVNVPEIVKFCLTTSNGRKTWDGKALEGEINHLEKSGQTELADRIRNCQKIGAPSTTFRTFAA